MTPHPDLSCARASAAASHGFVHRAAKVSRPRRPDKRHPDGHRQEPERPPPLGVHARDHLQRLAQVRRRQRQHQALDDRHESEAEQQIVDQSNPAAVLSAGCSGPSAGAAGFGARAVGECR